MNYSDYMVINYALPFLGFVITFIAQIYVNNSYDKYKYQSLKKELLVPKLLEIFLIKMG